jgi:hypothetical protein
MMEYDINTLDEFRVFIEGQIKTNGSRFKFSSHFRNPEEYTAHLSLEVMYLQEIKALCTPETEHLILEHPKSRNIPWGCFPWRPVQN